MTVSLSGVNPTLCDNNGGFQLALTGSFVVGRPYAVFVGTDATGILCYSGVSGQGAFCISADGQNLPCALPAVPSGDVPLCVVDSVDGTKATISQVLRAEPPFLDTMIYSLRNNMRPTLAVGDLDPSTLPPAVPVPGFRP